MALPATVPTVGMVSVVGRETSVRWLTVGVGAALVLATPTLAPAVIGPVLHDLARTGHPATVAPAPRALLRDVLASSGVPFQGMAESRGGLVLPDLPSFDGTAALLGGTTRSRVWWTGRHAWRVSVLTATGERGMYGVAAGVVSWDYERNELITTLGDPQIRLPRAEDLLPPQAARRLLAGVGPGDRVEALPARRVAGQNAAGLRVTPGDERSALGHIDVWVIRSGAALPVEVNVIDRAGNRALATRFLDLRLTPPTAADVRPPAAPGAHRETVAAPDVPGPLGGLPPGRLPGTLAGLPASAATEPDATEPGAATFGRGFVRIVVLPLPPWLAHRVLDDDGDDPIAASSRLELPGGTGAAVGNGLLQAVVAANSAGNRAYLVAGMVTLDVVRAAAAELVSGAPKGTR